MICFDLFGFCCRICSDFGGFGRILVEFYWISLILSDFRGFAWIQLDVVAFNQVLSDLLSDFVGFCRSWSELVGSRRICVDVVGICRNFLDFFGFHQFCRIVWDLNGFP